MLTKVPSSQSHCFSSSHVWMWELDHKESWASKNWCLRIVVLEKIPESPLGNKEIKPVNPKGNQPWILFGRTEAEAEALILWPPDAKNWFIGKVSDVGKDWRQEAKGMTEDEMVGWHHWLSGHEFEQALGAGDGQGSLAYCSPWGLKELDTTEQLYWNERWAKVSDGILISESPMWVKMLHIPCCCSVTKSYLIPRDPKDYSTPGFPVLRNLPEFAQTHIHWIGDAIQPSHTLSSPSPPALNLSQHQGLF